MSTDPQKLIQSMLRSELLAKDIPEHNLLGTGHCVVTLSRQCGAGGETAAHLLADNLKTPYFDKELLDEVAKEAGVERYLFERLDEQIRGMRNTWLSTLITSKSIFEEKFKRNLINVILGIAAGAPGGVIIGRGANFILEGLRVFRVRIVGSLAMRTARLAAEHGVPAKKAQKIIAETDQQRSEFVKELLHRDVNEPEGHDLVINSDHFEPAAIAGLILVAMEKAVCDMPLQTSATEPV